MSEKNSLAKAKYWSTISPEKRSEMSRYAATMKWSKVSVEDKRKHALLMVSGKKAKKVV